MCDDGEFLPSSSASGSGVGGSGSGAPGMPGNGVTHGSRNTCRIVYRVQVVSLLGSLAAVSRPPTSHVWSTAARWTSARAMWGASRMTPAASTSRRFPASQVSSPWALWVVFALETRECGSFGVYLGCAVWYQCVMASPNEAHFGTPSSFCTLLYPTHTYLHCQWLVHSVSPLSLSTN